MAIKIQHCALRSLLNCFSSTYWWGSFSRIRFILMNCVCSRAKPAALGKKDVQVGSDAKKLKILFEDKAALARFFLSSVEKNKNKKKVCLLCWLLKLQLNCRKWLYQTVVTSDQIQPFWDQVLIDISTDKIFCTCPFWVR